MRTKALLCAAALAAGALTSMAQGNVYSLNIVGYVNVPLVSGFNLIGNPLDNGTNDLNSLFPNANIPDTIYLYSGGNFTISTFTGSWNPDLTVFPGTGIFYSATVPYTNTFVGNVLTGNLTNPIPQGFSIRSSQVPQSDTLENLQMPANIPDTVYFYRSGGYQPSTFTGSWNPDYTVGVGEAFWVSATASENWIRTFNP